MTTKRLPDEWLEDIYESGVADAGEVRELIDEIRALSPVESPGEEGAQTPDPWPLDKVQKMLAESRAPAAAESTRAADCGDPTPDPAVCALCPRAPREVEEAPERGDGDLQCSACFRRDATVRPTRGTWLCTTCAPRGTGTEGGK